MPLVDTLIVFSIIGIIGITIYRKLANKNPKLEETIKDFMPTNLINNQDSEDKFKKINMEKTWIEAQSIV